MRFDKVIIVGSGDTAKFCSKKLVSIGVNHDVIETNVSSFSFLSYKNANTVNYYNLREFDSIDEAIISLSDGNTLVISANNNKIFKKSVNKDNITIINFHYGLLPNYRGMNIPTWVIYNEETIAGITWHYVNEKIDAGKIIVKASVDIDNEITAFELTRELNKLGQFAFDEFIEIFLEGELKTPSHINKGSYESKYYALNTYPCNGIFSKELPAKDQIKLLRAFDYLNLNLIPKLTIVYEPKEYTIDSYKYASSSDTHQESFKDNILKYQKDGIVFTLTLKTKS